MPIAQGSRFNVGIQVETTYGVAPATPTLLELPATSFNINPTKTNLMSEAFTADGQRKYQRHGNVAVAGDIAFEFADSDFDELLQGVMHNTFSTGVLVHGTGIRSYHIEGRHNDITLYHLVKGAVINQLTINSALDAKVTATASVIAKDVVTSGTSFDGTMTNATNTVPYMGKEATVSWNNATFKATSFALTINNNMEPNYVLGSDKLDSPSKGFIDVTGTFEVYLENSTFRSAFMAETESELELLLDYGGNSYTFTMPSTKLTSAESTVAGQGSVVVSCGFSATKNAGEGTTLKITKA